jgi:hypothetical protein
MTPHQGLGSLTGYMYTLATNDSILLLNWNLPELLFQEHGATTVVRGSGPDARTSKTTVSCHYSLGTS